MKYSKGHRLNWPSLKDTKPLNLNERLTPVNPLSVSELKEKDKKYAKPVVKLIP
jgi:hypothetical protein